MLSRIFSFGLTGLNGRLIEVEVDLHNGLPAYETVGLPDTAVKESRERVRSSIKNSGFKYPMTKIVVNLAPADIKKEGSYYDLPIALGIMCSSEQLLIKHIEGIIFLGELSLDGGLRYVKGILPMLISAQQQGYGKVIIPKANESEAGYIDGLEIYALSSLAETVDFLTNNTEIKPVEKSDWANNISHISTDNDMKYIKGQYVAKRAMEIAVAGGHNILLIGPPGAGKTMIAKAVPSIMPDLTFDEALEIAKIHSVAGELDEGFVTNRPFRAPHHTASTIALTGGGKNSKPGEISLAHNGVLFLDELPEYSRHTLETLRQPLEDNVITIARAQQTIVYPANFMLVTSMNPCPCGNYGSKTNECKCTATQIQKYLAKLSGPLLDRIDIHVEVDNISYDDLKKDSEAEESTQVKMRINIARSTQSKRFVGTSIHCNSQMSNPMTKKYCILDSQSEKLLETAFTKLKLSARAYNRILKVARTIADLEQEVHILPKHIAEAIQYRSLDRKYMI